MSDDAKNITDSAKPRPAAFDDYTDAEKKQMELGARMEHQQGPEREKTEEKIEDLEE